MAVSSGLGELEQPAKSSMITKTGMVGFGTMDWTVPPPLRGGTPDGFSAETNRSGLVVVVWEL